jgi:hypothetical protein
VTVARAGSYYCGMAKAPKKSTGKPAKPVQAAKAAKSPARKSTETGELPLDELSKVSGGRFSMPKADPPKCDTLMLSSTCGVKRSEVDSMCAR